MRAHHITYTTHDGFQYDEWMHGAAETGDRVKELDTLGCEDIDVNYVYVPTESDGAMIAWLNGTTNTPFIKDGTMPITTVAQSTIDVAEAFSRRKVDEEARELAAERQRIAETVSLEAVAARQKSYSEVITETMRGQGLYGKPASALDTQVGGDHYKKMGDFQPWEVLKHWLTPEEFHGYMKGTAIAYLARERSKGGNTDIGKAAHTLQGLLEMEDRTERTTKKEV